jgi:hypothetical protein
VEQYGRSTLPYNSYWSAVSELQYTSTLIQT